MEGDEVRIALLKSERSQRKPKADVVESVGFGGV